MKGKNKSCGSCMHYSRVSGLVNSSLSRGSDLCEFYDAGWAMTDPKDIYGSKLTLIVSE